MIPGRSKQIAFSNDIFFAEAFTLIAQNWLVPGTQDLK